MNTSPRGLPFGPPVQPMLAKLTRDVPTGEFLYEPKWDGFRAIAFCTAEGVDLRSRHDRPLSRYFPEVVAGLRAAAAGGAILDGELVAREAGDFAALMLRLHPAASRVELLSRETPVDYVAFDILAEGGSDLRTAPFAQRRARLERVLAAPPSGVVLSPATDDERVAARWLADAPRGVDGVVAKERGLLYLPGKRAMVKVKAERTADCVVAGFRVLAGAPRVGSLLLGLYDEGGVLRHVGVSGNFTEAARRELLAAMHPLITVLEGHPWEGGFGIERGPMGRLAGAAGRWDPGMSMDWIPVRPERVAEVAYDQLDGGRFRHPATFRRWRPDRDPASCTFEQLDRSIAPGSPALIGGATVG
jgi:ATP-dependent DNA ligase